MTKKNVRSPQHTGPAKGSVEAVALSHAFAAICLTGSLRRVDIAKSLGVMPTAITKILDHYHIQTPKWFAHHHVIQYLSDTYPKAYKEHGKLLEAYVSCEPLDEALVEMWASRSPDRDSFLFPHATIMRSVGKNAYSSGTPQALCVRAYVNAVKHDLGLLNDGFADLLSLSSGQAATLCNASHYLPRVEWFTEYGIAEKLKRASPKLYKEQGGILDDYLSGSLPNYSYDVFKARYPALMAGLDELAPLSGDRHMTEMPVFSVFKDCFVEQGDVVGSPDWASPDEKRLRRDVMDFVQEYHVPDAYGTDPLSDVIGEEVLPLVKMGDQGIKISILHQTVKELCAQKSITPVSDGDIVERQAFKLLSSLRHFDL